MGVSNYYGEYAVGSPVGELESLPAGTDRQCKQKKMKVISKNQKEMLEIKTL